MHAQLISIFVFTICFRSHQALQLNKSSTQIEPVIHIHGFKGATSSQILNGLIPYVVKRPNDISNFSGKAIFVNSLYGRPDSEMLQNCDHACRITSDLSEADAVVWNPRYMSPISNIPETKPLGQTWIFNFWFEAPIYNGHRISEKYIKQLDNKVDYTMTYMKKSDFFQPHQVAEHKSGNYEIYENVVGRDKLVLAMISNCISSRLDVLLSLQKFLPPGTMDIYGSCGLGEPCPGRDESSQCHEQLFSKYKFYAAFENSQCSGYITEKFWRAINEGMVPIAMGGMGRSDYEDVVPGDCFIHTDDFGSIESLANYLTSMSNTKYNNMSAQVTHLNVVRDSITPFCELCTTISNPESIPNPYKDLWTWFYEGTCREEAPYMFWD